MKLTKLTFPVSVFIFTLILDTKSTESTDHYCYTLNDNIQCENASEIRLTRLDGHEPGHTEKIETEDGRQIQTETLCVKPLIIEIKDFLTTEECKHLRELAKQQGLKSSETLNWSDKNRFVLQDRDRDQKLSIEEMKLTVMGGFDVHLDKDDILQMYKEMKMDADNDEYITRAEMEHFSPKHFEIYLRTFLKSHPEKHSRYSRQVWLYPDESEDEVFNKIINRVSSVVDLPVEILKLSDFQVVNYNIKGHYHAHWDSGQSGQLNTGLPCCDKVRKRNCRVCRYMTILFYLNDVEDGGETAFPLANNDTVSLEEIANQGLFNLNEKCGSPGIKVQAETGKAIIWYNHFVDPDSGWLGKLDEHTYHGGCPVKEGEKWIANFWIKVTDDKEEDLSRMHKYHEKMVQKTKKEKDEL